MMSFHIHIVPPVHLKDASNFCCTPEFDDPSNLHSAPSASKRALAGSHALARRDGS
jgi:hypothetical protein